MLTTEEKRVVRQFLVQKRSRLDAVFEYGIYVAPSLAFALYGIWRVDLIAVLVAYGALLSVVVLYLSRARRWSQPLKSAVRKYEQAVNALTPGE